MGDTEKPASLSQSIGEVADEVEVLEKEGKDMETLSEETQEAIALLSTGVLSAFLPEMENTKGRIHELTKNQGILIETMQLENTKFAESQEAKALIEIISQVRSYHSKLTRIQNEMAQINERVARLKTGNDVLYFKKMTGFALAPSRGSSHAAGYDLYSAYDVLLPAQGKALVKTDIAVAIPQGCYGRVAPRSSLAWKHQLDVGAGVIDRDYRGNLGVVMFNLGQADYQVKQGDRVAQLIVERISTPTLVEVEDLDSTERGAGGYGSTGK